MEGYDLVKTARNIIKTTLTQEPFEFQSDEIVGGIFVTLKKKGGLRGCIGIPVTGNLKERLWGAATGVINDPRFPKLVFEEMKEIEVEVSVLTEPKLIDDWKKITVGRHGIITRHEEKSGLLLPQVPIEQNWNLEEYLRYGCVKAGIDPKLWNHKKTQYFVFEAKVFKEIKPNGNVEEVKLR